MRAKKQVWSETQTLTRSARGRYIVLLQKSIWGAQGHHKKNTKLFLPEIYKHMNLKYRDIDKS